MLKALLKIYDGLALNSLEKYEKNPCNGYKRLVHLMQSDWGQSIDLVLPSTGWIDWVSEGKIYLKIFKAYDLLGRSPLLSHRPSEIFLLTDLSIDAWPIDQACPAIDRAILFMKKICT